MKTQSGHSPFSKKMGEVKTKRVFGIPEFHYYSIADGLTSIFMRHPGRIVCRQNFPRKACSSPALENSWGNSWRLVETRGCCFIAGSMLKCQNYEKTAYYIYGRYNWRKLKKK